MAVDLRCMKRLLLIVLNPYLLPLWVTIVVLAVFPLRVRKYTARVLESGSYWNDAVIRFDDLDQDGISEKILASGNTIGTASLTVSSPDGFLRQWTFQGRYDFVLCQGTVITGDRDGDGTKEIYVFTLKDDSILLHCIPDFRRPDSVWFNKFVARCGKSYNKIDPFIIPAKMDDLTGDGSRELIFGISTGFSLFPRGVFAYDVLRDTFMVSPHSGYFLQGIIQSDITGDGKKEIIPYGYATANITDSLVPFSDKSCWLMVLDQKLNFLFDPVPFPGIYSNLIPFVLNTDPGIPVLAALHRPPENLGDTATLYCFDQSGQIVKKIILPGNSVHAFSNFLNNGKEYLILFRNQNIELYDESFHKIRSIQTRISGPGQLIDIDLDGFNELVQFDLFGKRLTIFRNDLTEPVVMSFEGDENKGVVISVNKNPAKPPQIYLQLGSHFLQLQYERNPKYIFRFAIYGSVYLSILLFSLLVRKVQHDQFRKKQETEKKIADLQLQIVRNQLDPHFIMNAVNSILASINEEDKEEARQQLIHFSKLYRQLLLSSDHFLRSLKEEIEFIENYLALEKFRFKERFDYRIEVDPSVNLQVQVPKMILQIHVENAVKHGFIPGKAGGIIIIRIFMNQKILTFEISDNGKGRENARKLGTESTGKGLALMDEFEVLYNKYHPGRIITEITDNSDSAGNSEGTRVLITLSEFL